MLEGLVHGDVGSYVVLIIVLWLLLAMGGPLSALMDWYSSNHPNYVESEDREATWLQAETARRRARRCAEQAERERLVQSPEYKERRRKEIQHFLRSVRIALPNSEVNTLVIEQVRTPPPKCSSYCVRLDLGDGILLDAFRVLSRESTTEHRAWYAVALYEVSDSGDYEGSGFGHVELESAHGMKMMLWEASKEIMAKRRSG